MYILVLVQVIDNHATLSKHDGHHYAMTSGKTWVNDHLLPPGIRKQLRPGDVFSFGTKEAGLKFKIKMCAILTPPRPAVAFLLDSVCVGNFIVQLTVPK